MSSYLRLARGLQNQTSELLPLNTNTYEIIAKNPGQDYYTSLFTYNEDHAKHFKTSRSVAGLSDVKTKKLVFDFDHATDLEAARKDAVVLSGRLVNSGVPEDKVRTFFSGGKGFGVECITDTSMDRQEFVNVVFGLAGDLKTFDTRINDHARVIRHPLTRHPKSKLYKIPLTVDELKSLSMNEIIASAGSIEGFDASELVDSKYLTPMTEKLQKLKAIQYKKVGVTEVLKSDLKFDVNDINLNQCPRWLDKARYALSEGFFYGSETTGKGERNTAFMILAATFKAQGFSREHTLGLLMATADKQAQRTGEDAYSEDQLNREILNSVYSPSWNGGIFGKDEELLVVTRNRFGIDDITQESNLVTISNVAHRFKNFAANFHENRIFTGIKALDDKLVLTTGMAIGILGAPSSGKTTILNSIMEHQSEKNIPSIYQSLDMSDNLLYLRLMQKYSGLPIEKIIEAFNEKKMSPEIQEAYAQVLKNYSNVHFNFKSGMTVPQIDKDVAAYKQETGKSPKVIAIDYLEKIRTDFSDPTASSGMVAAQLSDLAKKYDAAVLVLLQPQKSAGAPDQELLSMRKVKGASQIEQDLRVILTVWRPGFSPQNPENDKYLSMAVVKNNLGGLCQLDFRWDGATGSIGEMDRDGKLDLKRLREDAQAAKQEGNGWDI